MVSFAAIAALNDIIEYCGMRTQKGAGKVVSRVFGVNSEFTSAIRGAFSSLTICRNVLAILGSKFFPAPSSIIFKASGFEKAFR